jgi:hypothetical protein
MRLLLSIFLFVIGIFLGACSENPKNICKERLEIIKGLVEQMEKEGVQLSESLDSLAHYYSYLIDHKDSILAANLDVKYKFDGAFSTDLPGSDSTKSTLIILNSTKDRKAAEREVFLTNSLDDKFAELYSSYRIIEQVYSNSALQVSRVYPIYDAKNIVDPEIDVTKFNFYYEADLEHNPGKGVVWIPEAYIDPAGKGWIVSLVHPIYEGEELFAVVGVDFTVDEVIQNYLDSEKGDFIIVSGKGDIVAGKASAIEALSMPPLKNHVYRETVRSDNFRISDFNLFSSKSREVRAMAQSFLLNRSEEFVFKEERNLQSAVCVEFSLIDWYLIEIIPSF